MVASDNLNAGQFGQPMSFEERDSALHRELGFNLQHLEGKRARHPRSGYMLRVGNSRHVAKPEGDEGPAEFDVIHNSLNGYPAQQKIRREPIKYVYRGMHEDEWAQAQQRGHIQSDKRGVIADWEGTNASTDARDAVSYLPRGGRGVVAKIAVHPDDKWFTIPHDQYLRSREPIPLNRVVRTLPLAKDERGSLYR